MRSSFTTKRVKDGAKIVQGEWRRKEKPKDFRFLIPSRSLSYLKIVQGEWRRKENAQLFHFLIPSRSLSYLKIVQGEWRRKENTQLFHFLIPSRILSVSIWEEIDTQCLVVRCHAGVVTLPCRRGNVVMPAWQRCYAGMATLLCRHGNPLSP